MLYRRFLITVATMVMIATSALSTTTSSAAVEPRLILPDGGLSLSQIRSMSAKELAVRIGDAAGAKVVVNKQELARTLSSRGDVLLPIASIEGPDSQSPEVRPLAIPNDAKIKYNRPLAGNGRSTLKVCQDWTTKSPTAWLSNNQVSSWPDADGYHHPSNSCMTQASAFGLYYQFHSVGWVKLSGLWGGTWLVQMWCD